MADVLATKYARALLDLVVPLSAPEHEAVGAGLRAFRDLYAASPELRRALDSPAVVIAARRRVIEDLATRMELGDLLRRFLLVVTEHGRLSRLPHIVTAFEELMDQQAGRVTADVAVPTEVTPMQRAEIEQRLAEITGKQVRARFTVDATLIGGFRAAIGSTVYDASLRGQLDVLRHRFQTVA
ncbi:MAG: ATP synthase F1 subunit delta [Bryobacterales bacterium]|nr:ATP synthase F1 subunit delta [Bryobacterales bacterium]